jgi:alpha-glucosidase
VSSEEVELASDAATVVLEPAVSGCRALRWAPRGVLERPSFTLCTPPRLQPLANVPSAVRLTRKGSEFFARIELPKGTNFYGTGEVAGSLERSGKSVQLWNTDSYEYDERNTELYQSHPFVLAVLPDGSARGYLADTIRRGWIRTGVASTAESVTLEFQFEGESFDLYVLEGEHPRAVCQALAALVGAIAMPPLWALGYHQCRWSYGTAAELRLLAAEFRRRGIPCDALWLDIDYMDRARVFTVDERAFPDLAVLTRELRASGFRSVAILDPGIATDSELAAEGVARELFVKAADGTLAVGKVWPGPCHFPDFTSRAARAWWSEHVRAFLQRTELDGLWNDMNEPSVMDGPNKTLPEDCRHAGVDGSGGDHARWHNLYGALMIEATRAGFVAARPEARPFVLTRSNHLGGARHAATWTGDNRATWEHLRWSIAMVLNLGLSGQPFSGPDVGGFSDNPDSELFTRWFELGAFLPFFRGHAEKPTRRKEPWAFGPEVEAHVRRAIERRMKLLPTLYTLFREAHERGLPIARPLFFADPADKDLRVMDDAFLLGDDLLVAPIVHERARERDVVFPRHPGGWYPFPEGGSPILERTRAVAAPLGTVPLFARAGAVLFEHEPRPSTATAPRLLVVHVFCDPDGRARGRLYEDEGEGHAHARGVHRDTRFEAQASEAEVVIEERASGSFVSSATQRLFVIHVGGKTLLAPRALAERYVIPREVPPEAPGTRTQGPAQT